LNLFSGLVYFVNARWARISALCQYQGQKHPYELIRQHQKHVLYFAILLAGIYGEVAELLGKVQDRQNCHIK
jgi:hypothetical protein